MKIKSLFFMTCIMACASAQMKNFTNPIFDTPGTEPSVLKLGNEYFITFSGNQNTEIHIYKSPYLTSFRYIEQKVLYKVNAGYSGLLAPRLQNVDDQLYIYFAMRNETVSHKMYVMKALDPTNPMGGWTTPQRLLENMWNLASIHGTVLSHNARNYFVWTSPQAVASTRDIYIAPMVNPMEVVEPVVLLKYPTEQWECLGYCSNEAPSFIYKNGTVYLVYSAGPSDDPDRSLSLMSIGAGRDPMNPSNWSFSAVPVFTKDDEEGVYGPGHSSFTSSPDGSETWMVYHASETSTDIAGSRTVRVEKIGWDEETKLPIFPTAHGFIAPLPRPSGEPEMFVNPVLDVQTTDSTVIRVGGYYYLVRSDNQSTELTLLKSSTLSDFGQAEKKIVYSAEEGYRTLQAGKIHLIEGQLYIYFAMRNETHGLRPYVTAAVSSDDPMGSWSAPKRLLENLYEADFLHGSVLTMNEIIYFVWSIINPGNETAKSIINIAQMQNPGEVVAPVVLLRKPFLPWECYLTCENNAPVFVYNGGIAFMMFFVSSPADPRSSISYMSIETHNNPLDVSNWASIDGPAFQQNIAEDVYAPLNPAFTTSLDETETWMIYHASSNASDLGGTRLTRIEKIEWDPVDGYPIFPKPHGSKHPQPVPSNGLT